MKYLVIGSGAREHSLAWKLAQEGQVYAAPGNPGMEDSAEVFPQVASLDSEACLSLCLEVNPDLVVVGPEDPLIRGLADTLAANGYPVFGPSKAAAQLEGSKAFSKRVMARAGVPTAAFEIFTEPEEAREFVRRRFGAGRQVAVKASGAALGKGVIVCETLDQGLDAVERLMVFEEAGEAGHTLVIEDRLMGKEFSLLTLVSDKHFVSLPPAQDHKRAFDGDEGPNTGGMGAFSPVSWVSDDLMKEAEERVVAPILAALAEEGIPYRGCLFSGLMATEEGAMCLEYNVRLGDPECQAVMRRLGQGLGASLLACAEGQEIPGFEVLPHSSVALSLVSEGYPGPIEKGRPLALGPMPEGVVAFHAGTGRASDGSLIATGGRVISLTAVGSTLSEARELAYQGASQVSLPGMRMRSDIGLEAPKPSQGPGAGPG